MKRRPFLALAATAPIVTALPAVAEPVAEISKAGWIHTEYLHSDMEADDVAKKMSLRFPGRPYMELRFWRHVDESHSVPHRGWGILMDDASARVFVGPSQDIDVQDNLGQNVWEEIGSLRGLADLLEANRGMVVFCPRVWDHTPIVKDYGKTFKDLLTQLKQDLSGEQDWHDKVIASYERNIPGLAPYGASSSATSK